MIDTKGKALENMRLRRQHGEVLWKLGYVVLGGCRNGQ